MKLIVWDEEIQKQVYTGAFRIVKDELTGKFSAEVLAENWYRHPEAPDFAYVQVLEWEKVEADSFMLAGFYPAYVGMRETLRKVSKK